MDDEARRTRRRRVDDRLRAEAPDRSGARGEGAPLRHRLGATDRAGRFRTRHEAVVREHARRVRRARRLRRLGTTVVVLLAVGLGIGVADRLGSAVWGAAAAAGVAGLFLAGRRVAERLAERRGPEAWDWQAGRHRLLGQPARRVQELDRPPTQRR